MGAEDEQGRLPPLAACAVATPPVGSGPICETVNHKGHEGTRRKRLRPRAFVILRVLGGSGSCGLHRETDPLPARARNITASRHRLPYSEEVNGRTWKAWLVPGGLLLALAAALVNSSLFVQIAPSLAFYYVAVFTAGLILAWRFNSSRVFFSLLVLLLAHRAVNFFSAGQVSSGPGRMAV